MTEKLLTLSRLETALLVCASLLVLLSLAGGFGCGALTSITLRRCGFMADRSFQ